MSKLNTLTSLTINNYRVFSSETQFEFAPITILTGTNSSGKSSLTKLLMLLARSYQISGLRKLNLFESDLKIGGFKSIKNNKSSSDLISFELKLEPSKLELKLHFSEQKLSAFEIYENGILFLADLIDPNSNCGVRNYLHLPEEVFDKEVFRNHFKSKTASQFDTIFESILNRFRRCRIVPPVRWNQHGRKSVFFESFIDWIEGMQELRALGNPFNETPELYLFDIMPDLVIEFGLDNLMLRDCINGIELLEFKLPFEQDLDMFFNQFILIPSVRAKQEFLITATNSPILFRQIEKYHVDIMLKNRTNDLLEKWLVEEFKLMDFPEDEKMNGSLFQIVPMEDLGYQLQLCVDGKWTNLGSVGYGISQLLPILLGVILNEQSKTFIVEEPESNLHPALQSKLADFFFNSLEVGDPARNKQARMDAAVNGWIEGLEVKKNRFVIETHSEYLIRKLQYLIASNKSEMSPKDTVIYYFYNPKDIPVGEPQVYKINISENGGLSKNFGKGFLDESSNLSLLLYQTLSNKN